MAITEDAAGLCASPAPASTDALHVGAIGAHVVAYANARPGLTPPAESEPRSAGPADSVSQPLPPFAASASCTSVEYVEMSLCGIPRELREVDRRVGEVLGVVAPLAQDVELEADVGADARGHHAERQRQSRRPA